MRLMVNSTASMGHKKSTIQVIAYLKLFSIFKIRVCSHVSHMLLEICQIHWTTVEKKGRNSIHIHTHRQTQGYSLSSLLKKILFFYLLRVTAKQYQNSRLKN